MGNSRALAAAAAVVATLGVTAPVAVADGTVGNGGGPSSNESAVPGNPGGPSSNNNTSVLGNGVGGVNGFGVST